MTRLRETVDEYLAIRRGLGFKLKAAAYLLVDFVAYYERIGAARVTSDMVLTWAKQPANTDPIWWRIRLGVIRRFALYLHSIDNRHEVPPSDVFPAQQRRAVPYLYSEPEVGSLIEAARELRVPLRAATYATLIALLAVTGMRVGEAIALDRDDIDWTEGVLTVRLTKFGKSRELVLHPSAVDALQAYDRQRHQFSPRPKTAAFFVSTTGNRLLYNDVHDTFLKLVEKAGLVRRSPRCRPRLHDLRHTFAVSTLLGWYQAGVDVATRMYLLSTYLGHTNPGYTYWYLTAAPELMALAADRLGRELGELP